MKNKKFVVFLLLLANISYSQVTDKQILKHMNAKEIEWLKNADEPDLAKVKMKSTKKWGVYRISAFNITGDPEIEYDEIIPAKFDSIGWFKGMEPFTIVKDEDKYGILLNPYEVHDAAKEAKCKYDAVKMLEKDGRYYSLVRRGTKWGLIDWFEGIWLVDPSFESSDEVPLVWVESWAIDSFKENKQKLNADILIFDEGNGDGVFKARDKATKKWGMYQSLYEGKTTILIPAKYDSLRFFPFNGEFTAVYNDGKVGFYLSYWSYESKAKQTVKCLYEDYQRFNNEGVKYLAVKKNGKWGWVDWLTGEEKSVFKSKTTENLPFPHYEQETWLKE